MPARNGDRGFGALEALIAMFLLAVIAVAFLPMIMTGLRSAVANTTATTATQLVNEQLAPLSAKPHSCTAVQTWLGTSVPTVTDPRGQTISIQRSGPASLSCSTPPTTVTVTVTATGTDPWSGDARTWATATTIVLID
ncbi:type IV pilus modification PilV family protein [Microbacterium lacusdiani]